MKDFALSADGDLVPSSDGWFETASHAGAAAYYQLSHWFDAWWADAGAGSQLHRLREYGDGPAGVDFLRTELERCLGVLVTEGLIADLVVLVERSRPGRLLAEVTFRDLTSNQVLERVIDPFADPGGP